MALAAYLGYYWILSGYDMSRDEQMATFDAAVFAQRELVAPLAGTWRDHADALNTMFMYPAKQSAGWISAYLPLNAALRALLALAGDAALTGPLMTMLSALALWGCTRRIWPDRHEAPIVAILLYAGAGQITLNAMTAYAMPAHLALNLCWLWLFLHGTKGADVAALAVGFIAVGLHQPIMHPMFAAPILFLLVLQRDWTRAALYLVGYAAIGTFWAWWPGAMWSLVEADALARPADGVDYLSRLAITIEKGNPMRFPDMMANLLRYVAWQHLLLIPLFLIGLRQVAKDRIAAALAAGILLTILVMTVILPYQGHGFGYRYLHGLIGSAILLGVYGWTSLGEAAARWRPLLVRTTAASLFILLPAQAWMAHAFYAPAADVSARIGAADADYVIVRGDAAPFATDFVVNPPYLDERPIRLLNEHVDVELAAQLCTQRRGVVVAVARDTLFAPVHTYYGFGAPPSRGLSAQQLKGQLEALGCQVRMID